MKDSDTLLLIAAGPRQHTPALQRAFDLARAGEMPVHICLLAHDPLIERTANRVHPDVRQVAQREFLEQHRAWLDTLAARWTADGLEVICRRRCCWCTPAPATCRAASSPRSIPRQRCRISACSTIA